MQLLTMMIVAIMSVGFVSCGSDDDDDDIVNNPVVTANNLVGTWRKYKSEPNGPSSTELANVLWVFEANGMMYEHDIDDNLNIVEGHTETFKYKTENGHLYTQKQKAGKEYDWKDNGVYTIANNILTVTKDSGIKRYLKIK